ncbi:MAG TPA: ABC transporter transmembrane domain-containing protein [Limnochordia bacterium]|nr:ABC transporter transmembrane domain-containing protein [Limnochordia bacterium]
MDFYRDIPEYVQKAIETEGISQEQIRAIAHTDLDHQGNFRAAWHCVDDRSIYIFAQTKRSQGLRKVVPFVRRQEKEQFFAGTDERNFTAQVELIEKYELESLNRVRCEYFVGSIAIITKIDDQERVICRASKGRGAELNAFCRVVNHLIEKSGHKPDEDKSRREERCPKCGRLYPDPSRPVCPNCIDKRTLFKRVLALTPKYKGPITAMVTIMIISSLMGLAPPFMSGRIIIDEVLTSGGKYEGMIGQAILITVAFSLVSLSLGILHGRINSAVTAEIIYDLKKMIFSAMQRLSLSFYNKRQTGSLMNRVNSDALDLQHFFHDGVPYFIVNSVQIIGVTCLLLFMNWRLTLLVFVPIPLILFITYKVLPHLWKLHSRRWRTNAALNSVVNDSLTGIRVVKAFGKEDQEVERFSSHNERVFNVQMSIGRLNSTVFPSMGFIMGLGQLIIWGVGGWDVISGRTTLGTLITFTGYLGMLYQPIQQMTNIVDWWSSCMNSAQRIFEIIDSTEHLPYPEKPVRMPQIKGEVIARDVEFSYEEGRPVLQEINFHVEPGEMIGFVGPSGAGKSTMINLIARLYDVDSGAITIDGVNIKDIAKDDLHRQVGMVLQETFLFRGSIMENIAYAKPDATSEEIIRATKIANAHDFIMKLPDGYETVIGRKGHDLSGGERQRLAIARAVLLDPRILILDEATANIDTETEQLIQEALEQLVEGRTTFVIAHRLSTLRKANRLFVFDEGRIVEVGTHDELMERKGVYEKLFTTQRKALEQTAVGG